MPTSKALRQWLAAIRGAAPDRRRPGGGWKEPTQPRRDHRPRRPRGAGGRPRRAAQGRRELGAGRLDGGVDRRRAARCARRSTQRARRELERAPSEPGVWPALGRVPARRRQLVFAASSMPVRDQEAFLPPGRDARALPRQPRRQRDRRARLHRGSAPPPQRRPDLGRARRPRLAHDLGGLAAARRRPRAAARRARQRRRRDLPLPAPGRGGRRADEFEALLGTPVGAGPAAAPPSSSGWTSQWPETRKRSSRLWRGAPAS